MSNVMFVNVLESVRHISRPFDAFSYRRGAAICIILAETVVLCPLKMDPVVFNT